MLLQNSEYTDLHVEIKEVYLSMLDNQIEDLYDEGYDDEARELETEYIAEVFTLKEYIQQKQAEYKKSLSE
jgi:hypothetical protein